MHLSYMDNHESRYCNIITCCCLMLMAVIMWQPIPAAAGNRGLLWRIHLSGHSPSYLLGTIHSADPRVARLSPGVARALDQSDHFIMEMALDTDAFMQFGAVMLLEEGQDLEDIVGKKLYTQVVTAMASTGLPDSVVRRLKPWVVMTMLGMPKSEGGLILDMVLYQRAAEQGKPTSGLETAQEQLSVFDGLSHEDQIALLKVTLEQLPSQAGIHDQLIEAYAANDLRRIQVLSEQNNRSSMAPVTVRFMRRLNDDRNRRMVQRMIPYLKQGNCFIAVGALHLGGPHGILALLEKYGCRAEPMR